MKKNLYVLGSALALVAVALPLRSQADLSNLSAPAAITADTPVTIMAAGDIAEAGTSTQADATSTGNLIRAANPAYVLTLGDNAYPDGSATDYSTKYDPTWGSFKAKTKPVPGNHEYHANPPAGYLGYFGQANVTTNNSSSQVWYASDLGNGWRAYALNSEVSASAGSAQDTWLAADLAAHPNMHYIAYWHQPRYVSGTSHTDQTTMCPLWNRLQGVGADLALVGHEHHYERFAKMDCAGATASVGVREFVVGTGGNWTYPLSSPLHANSQSSQDTDFGVLKLVLHTNSYDWSFIESGRCFNTSTNTSSDCATHNGVVFDSGTQATNTTLASDPAMPALPTGTRHFTTNEGTSKAAAAALGYNLHDTAPSVTEANALSSLPGNAAPPYADKGIVDLTEKCPSGATTAFKASVDALKTNPRVFAYYLSDEPDDPGCAAGMKAEVDYIHANAPGQLAFVELTDWPGTYSAYRPAATNVDVVGIDPYPCQRDNNQCDLGDIDAQVNAAIAAGIPRERLVPTFQTFGLTSTWFPPSAAQLQSILDRWASLLPTPVFDYAYSWNCNFGCDANSASISTRTDWQSVLRTYNTTFPTTRNAPPAPTNQAPTVSAGADLTITLPAVANLDGTVSDDGLPNNTLTTTWSKVSGPGTVTFGNANAVDTTATFSVAGTYVLRLTANDSAFTTTDDATVTVNPAAGGGGTLDRRVASSFDDVEQQTGGSIYASSSDLELAVDGSINQQVGIHFPNMTIPQGATITTAWIDFTAKETWSGATSLTFASQAADNAPIFTSATNDVSSRAMNPTTVPWAPAAQTAGLHYLTPSLVSLVQQVVSRPGWASGNGLVIKVTGTGTRTEYAFDGSATTVQPSIHVVWS